MLTIAGSDSGAGAGLQMDLKVFAALGMWGCCAATALTAQNTRAVHRILHVPPRFVAAQIDAVASDLPPDAVKTGMLGRAQVVRVVADRLRRRRLRNVVVDPVILASDGTPLLAPRGVAALREELLAQARVVTPNVAEAEQLAGMAITDEESMQGAARAIAAVAAEKRHSRGGGRPGGSREGLAVVIKGGHRAGDAVDLLFDGETFHRFGGARVEGPPVHGTGCVYSAALAARLAAGDSVVEACRFARHFVEEAIRGAVSVGKGAAVMLAGVAGQMAGATVRE